MDFRIQLAVITLGVAVLLSVALAVRNAKLYPSYTALWAALGGLLVLLPLYAGMLRWLATDVFGIVGANHLIYASLFGFILLYIFYLTQKICQLTNQVERVIVALAILEKQFKDAMALTSESTAKRE